MGKKPTQKSKEIKPVNAYIKIRKNAVLIEWKEKTFITSVELLKKLTDGDLITKAGTTAKSIKLGILEDTPDNDGTTQINNGGDTFLTKKNGSYYFSVDGELLITSVFSVNQLLTGEWEYVKMGMFQ